MDPLSITASIIAILEATTSVISFLNHIKDAPKERIKLEIEVSNLYSLLTHLNCRLAEADSNEAWFASVRTLNHENGPLDLYKIALKGMQAKLSNKRFGSTIQWLNVKKDVTKILSSIERLKPLIVIALQLDHFKLSQAIRGELNIAANEAIPRLEQNISAVQHYQEDDKRNQILTWISPKDYAALQSDLINKRYQGTNQWFLDSPVFLSWKTSPEKTTLWCNGLPGAGKTIAAATAIEHLSGDPKSQVAYVFCDFKEQNTQTTTYLLCAILQQLSSAQQIIPEPVVRLYEKHSKARTKPAAEECFGVLKAIVTNIPKFYLIVDALDECTNKDGTRSQFLKRIRKLHSSSNLRLMVTSRSIPEIANEFEHDSILEVRARESDIKQYVNGQMYRLPKCIQRDKQLQQTVQNTIAKAAGGMFLLASLHVVFFLDKKTKARVHSTLKELPKGSEALNEAYDEAIRRIESGLPEDSALAKVVLSWIVHSQRSLTTQELCHAIAVEAGDTELDQDKIPEIEDVISVCAGLVTIDEESNIVRLVHHTLQDYFLKIRTGWNSVAHKDIASTCITQLSFRKKLNPFSAYAEQYWTYHAMHAEGCIEESASKLLFDEKRYSTAAHVLSGFRANLKDKGPNPLEKHEWGFSQASVSRFVGVGALNFPEEITAQSLESTANPAGAPNLLCIAAMLGLVDMFNLALDSKDNDPSWVNSRDSQGRTALSYSAEFRQDKVAKDLLDRDCIDINSIDRHGMTPLYYAMESGYKPLVELLLGREDLDINAQHPHGDTYLLRAVKDANPEFVRFLTEQKRVEVNGRDRHDNTPLLLAVKACNLEIVELLLKREELDVNAWERHERNSPLLLAVKNGHLETVELLLRRREIHINVQDRGGGTPLSRAAEQGHVAVVKALLEKSRHEIVCTHTEINAQDEKGWTILFHAAWHGEEEFVESLLTLGAAVDHTSYTGSTALFHASENHHKNRQRIIEILVNHGARVDEEDQFSRTPLSYAAWDGNTTAIRALVVLGAGVNLPDRWGRTALLIATANNQKEAVELLINSGADTTWIDCTGRTALYLAKEHKYRDIVDLMATGFSIMRIDYSKSNEPDHSSARITSRQPNQPSTSFEILPVKGPRGEFDEEVC